ncbi:MAG: hypothetical protein ACLPX9_08300 [Rhodomicrobium sp.]
MNLLTISIGAQSDSLLAIPNTINDSTNLEKWLLRLPGAFLLLIFEKAACYLDAGPALSDAPSLKPGYQCRVEKKLAS